MSYFTSHHFFTLLPILPADFYAASQPGWRATAKVSCSLHRWSGVYANVDNYLIGRGVWVYGAGRKVWRIGYALWKRMSVRFSPCLLACILTWLSEAARAHLEIIPPSVSIKVVGQQISIAGAWDAVQGY